MPTLMLHNKPFEVRTVALRTLAHAKDPTDPLIIYKVLRLEGYSEAELDTVAQTTFFPQGLPWTRSRAEQLPLFDVAPKGNPWQRLD